jgi:hypothetical protein
MKLLSIKTIFLIPCFVSGTILHAQPNPPAPEQLIDQLKPDAGMEKFYRCEDQIIRKENISDIDREKIQIRFLVIIHHFLRTHTMPEGTVYMNMPPPDGGPSGSSPKDVEDPVLRAQYIKMLADNETLSLAKNKYSSLTSMRADLVRCCNLVIRLDPGNLKIVSNLLHEHTKDPIAAKELMYLIDQSGVESKMKPLDWKSVEKK